MDASIPARPDDITRRCAWGLTGPRELVHEAQPTGVRPGSNTPASQPICLPCSDVISQCEPSRPQSGL
jgi:hypothetical protein